MDAEGEQPLAELALSLNLRRRHLDESQRALVDLLSPMSIVKVGQAAGSAR